MVKFLENPIEYLRTQGKPPKSVPGKGGADQFGKIIIKKSVKEQKAALAAKNKKAKSPVVNKKNRRYSDNVTKSNTKVGTVFSGEARNIADAKKRKSKTFINKKGKKLAAVTKEELAASGLTLRQYLNKQQGKTAKGSTTKGLDGPKKNVKRPDKKTFKENLPPYSTMGYFGTGGAAKTAGKLISSRRIREVAKRNAKGDRLTEADLRNAVKLIQSGKDGKPKFKSGGKVVKAVKGAAINYVKGVVTKTGKKVKARMTAKERKEYVKKNIDKAGSGKIKLKPDRRVQNLLDPSESRLKGVEKFIAKKFGIDTKKSPGSVRTKIEEEMIKRENKDRASSYEPRFKSKGGMLKNPPAGSKGKGLRKLPTSVRNKMGYKKRGGMLKMSGGGSASGFGRAAMRPGKDPRTISKT